MSYQKKSLILQELEQAIRKKAQEKSRNKEQVNRALQGSIEKKKNVLKTATNKDARVSSIHKNSDTSSKPNLPDKPVSIFNNDHLNAFDSNEFKAKKYNNRRLDKLVSLIQYMMSSSEKALRYISSTNFEAEFALKLYRSDRENLVNELRSLNLDDIMDSQRTLDKNSNPDQAYNLLIQQNNKLKKQILILQKQAESFHNKVKDNDSIQLKQLERENSKLKEMLRKLMPFQGFKQVIQFLDKQNKFEIMSIKSQQNSKKTTEIQIVISSLENQRSNIIESFCKTSKEGRTDRGYKLTEIQAEKQQLQKELAQMKVKLAEIIDSSKSINELQLLKKNSELITQKLIALHKDLSPNSPPKKNNEQIIEQIRVLSLGFQQKNHQLSTAITRLSQENEGLNQDIGRLKEEKKLLESDARQEGQTVRMESMLSEISKLRDIVDELGHGQQLSSQKITDLQQQLKAKQDYIEQLTGQLSEAVEKSNEFKDIINQLNEEITHIQTEFNRTVSQNTTLKEKLRATQNDIISNSYSKEELKSLQTEKQTLLRKLQTTNSRNNSLEQQLKDLTGKVEAANSKNNSLEEQMRELQSDIIEKDEKIEDLTQKLKKGNTEHKNSQLSNKQALKELNTTKKELELITKEKESSERLLEQQRQKHLSEYESLSARLHETELLNIKIVKEKAQAIQELEIQKEMVESLNKKITILEDDVRELQDEIRSLTLVSNEALTQKQHSIDLLHHVQEEKQILKNQLTSAKQQMEDHSEIIKSKNKQYVNLLRQILKGLMLDPSEYADKDTFQELLQFGSQQVVQLRKRQREEESNKRKNYKREYDNILTDFNEQSLKECKVQLFQTIGHQSQDQGLLDEKIDIDEFNELKEQPNDSIISEQNQTTNQEVANLGSQNPKYQRMSSSKDENEDICYLPEKLSLNSVHRSLEEPKKRDSEGSSEDICYLPEKLSLNSVHISQQEPKYEIFEKTHYQIFPLTTSVIHHKNPNQQPNYMEQNVTQTQKPFEIIVSSQKQLKNQPQQGQLLEEKSHHSRLQDDSQMQGDERIDNNSMLFNVNLNLDNLLHQPIKSKEKIRAPQGYSKHTLLSIALKDQRLDLDQFQEAKSVQGNHSFVSSNDNFESNKQIAFNKHENGGMTQFGVKIIPLDVKNVEKESKDMNLSEFKEIQEDPLSQSIVSEKQNEHNIDQFGEIGQSELSQSMVSVKEQQQQSKLPLISTNPLTTEINSAQMGLQQFRQVENHINDSMLSQNKSQHGLSQFGQLNEEQFNQSIVSDKIDKQIQKEHAMSQFEQAQQDQMNDSILLANQNLKNSNHSQEKGNFDDFDEYKSQKMNESMVSMTSEKEEVGLQNLKSEESFESS